MSLVSRGADRRIVSFLAQRDARLRGALEAHANSIKSRGQPVRPPALTWQRNKAKTLIKSAGEIGAMRRIGDLERDDHERHGEELTL